MNLATVTLELPHDFVGQMLDGLDVIIEQWRYTADSFEDGLVREDMCIRECSGPDEAIKIADYYTRIREAIAKQYDSAQSRTA